ncbi:MAG: DUF3488 domain-containing protein [Candidatus Nitrospinota bacterium M3_3B_026]
MRKLLIAFLGLAIAHCAVSALMSLAAHSPFLAAYHNGRGLWNFAMDSFTYHEYALEAYERLKENGFAAWLQAPSFRHSKYVGLFYYLIYPSPISFAPVNAAAWAAGVILVYLTAMMICNGDRRLSIIAALVFGLWPSNLLHGTQLLREPFFNLGIVAMLFGWTAMLYGRRGAVYSLSAALGLIFSAGIRHEPFWLLFTAALIATVIIALRAPRALPYAALSLGLVAVFQVYPAAAYTSEAGTSVHEKKIAAVKERIRADLGGAYTAGLDRRITRWFTDKRVLPWGDFETRRERLEALAEEHGDKLDAFLAKWMAPWRYSSWLPRKVERQVLAANRYRDGFLVWYLEPGTSLTDSGVMFRSMGDVIAYVPRAALIGFFAPFPNQWLTAGRTGGGAIRAIGGAETLALYALMAGFVFFLIKSPAPARVKAWLVLFMVVMILPLGLFVPNIGTLYRMRFVYTTPIIIGGIQGAWMAAAWAARRFSQDSLQDV